MSDNPSNDPPTNNPLGNAGADAEIDALLKGAAELAAGLEEEIGADSDPPSQTGAHGSQSVESQPTEPAPAGSKPAESESVASQPNGLESAGPQQDAQAAPAIDAQLDQIDSLLNRACEELGPNDAPRSPATAADESARADATESHADLPDQFAELSDVGDLPDLDDLPDFDPPTPGTKTPPAAKPKRDRAAGAAEHPSGRWWSVVHRAVDLLDLLDKPLGWISYETRVVIGWAAVAILFAAACITAVSIVG